MIGDTIRFTSTHPFRIKITGRTKQYINIAGEELMVENAEQALSRSCIAHNCSVTDYTVGPIMSQDLESNIAHHHWIIEFNFAPQDMKAFGQDLDQALRDINSDYDAKRKGDLNLTTLQVESVLPGTFLGWMKHRGKLGGQNKVPRLHPNHEYINDLHEFLENKA
jgi:hypothetical protein